MVVTFFNRNCCTYKTVATAFPVSVVSRRMLLSFYDRVKKGSPVKMAERFVAVFANDIHLEGLKHLLNVFGSCGYSGFVLYRSSAGRQRRSGSSRKRCQLNQFSLMLLCLVWFLAVCCLCPACCAPPHHLMILPSLISLYHTSVFLLSFLLVTLLLNSVFIGSDLL